MKLTDFALIFVAVFLPVVVLVFVNTSFVVKSEKQEMYYKNLMNSAITDAVSSMKHIENEDTEIDYGYSGIVDKKVSVNAKTAVNTFYNSLANNFNILNNEMSLERLKMYIPVIAILDYDGIYIHSAEQAESGDITFITKPKTYYTYSYVITKKTDVMGGNNTYEMVELSKIPDIKNAQLLSDYIYEITFTMDDYVYLNIYNISDEITEEANYDRIEYSKRFYLEDNNNNKELIYEYDDLDMLQADKNNLRVEIIRNLKQIKNTVIAEIGMKEISYAINKHNNYAKQFGINYRFTFSVESDAVWYETMDGIGMIALIQGISLGNRYLNYKAYSASDLILTNRYYVSKGTEGENLAYLHKDLYHMSNRCDVYLEYINSTRDKIVPSYYTKKADAATQGFYPCPVCKP